MSSYVIVELDTTAPHIDIYAPRYTTRESLNIITIESDEALAEYQDVYVLDKNGDRHNFTFNRDTDNQYIGIIKFNTMPLGIVQIFARMKDEVDNFSNVASATIEIKNTLQSAVAKVNDKARFIVKIQESKSDIIRVTDKNRKVVVSDITMKENLNDEQ